MIAQWKIPIYHLNTQTLMPKLKAALCQLKSKSGIIEADMVDEIIMEKDVVMECNGTVKIRKKVAV